MKLILKNQVDELAKVVPFLESFVEENKLPQELMFQLNLVLDEILTNVIFYAFPENGKYEFSVENTFDGKSIKIEVRDKGVPFDPTQQPEADTTLSAEDRPIGGLGISIVREMMDSVDYVRENDENILTLKKTI